jgi:hypothetical protein
VLCRIIAATRRTAGGNARDKYELWAHNTQCIIGERVRYQRSDIKYLTSDIVAPKAPRGIDETLRRRRIRRAGGGGTSWRRTRDRLSVPTEVRNPG